MPSHDVDDEVRVREIRIKLSDQEMSDFIDRARAAGDRPSVYARKILLAFLARWHSDKDMPK